MKSVQILSFSGPCFPIFSPNTGKYGPEKTPYLDIFHAVHFKRFILGFLKDQFLGPLRFNIFINDLIGFKKSLHYTILQMITAFEKNITLLKETLLKEAEIGIQWFQG